MARRTTFVLAQALVPPRVVQAEEPAAEHPFRDAIVAARAARDPDPILSTLRDAYHAALAPGVVEYVQATLGVERILGPYNLDGIGPSLRQPDPCRRRIGAFDDTPFPALRVGSDRFGVDFWLVLDSGKVITLHHDASFAEQAAVCAKKSLPKFLRAFEKRGSIFDIGQLVELQVLLHEADPKNEEERVRATATAAASVLGITLGKLATRVGVLPLEMLHLEAARVDEIAAEKPARKKGKPKAPAIPPPLAKALREGARTLDLGTLLDKRLPEAIGELKTLEELDLSANPSLDFEEAFSILAALPNLRRVRFDDCRLEKLPSSIGNIASLEEVSLRSSMLKGPVNRFDLAQALPILSRLPRLRVLDASINRAHRDADVLGMITAMPALEELSLASVFLVPMLGVGEYLRPALRGHATLRRLDLGRLGADALLDAAPAAFPQLEALVLDHSQALPRTEGGEDYEAYDRLRDETHAELARWIARLPALRTLDFRIEHMNEPPRGLAGLPLRELWLDGSLPEWIGEMRTLRVLHAYGLVDPPPASIGELAELEVLDFGDPFGSTNFPSLPDSISKLTSLEKLTLGGAALESWPDLSPLTALETFTFYGNPPPSLSSLTSLRKSDGPVSELVKLPKLESIVLSLSALPDGIEDHPSIRSVTLSAHGFEGDVDAAFARIARMPALASLELSGFSTLSDALVTASLRHLGLRLNPNEKPGIDLDRLFLLLARASLESLSIESTRRPETIPESLGGLGTLRTLRLRGIGITALPDSIAQLGGLERLELLQTGIRAPARKKLRKLLPGCRIRARDF